MKKFFALILALLMFLPTATVFARVPYVKGLTEDQQADFEDLCELSYIRAHADPRVRQSNRYISTVEKYYRDLGRYERRHKKVDINSLLGEYCR